jgi:hypothetical protein
MTVGDFSVQVHMLRYYAGYVGGDHFASDDQAQNVRDLLSQVDRVFNDWEELHRQLRDFAIKVNDVDAFRDYLDLLLVSKLPGQPALMEE